MTWPPRGSTEPPRYAYAGELYGEDNFRRPTDGGKTMGQILLGALQWIVGLYDAGKKSIMLQRPQSGAVDSAGQRIFVTDTNRQAIYVFDQNEGRLDVWESATSTDHFVGPSGIVLGLNGEVYVADTELGYVTRLDKNGTSLGIIGKGLLKRPLGLAFDKSSQELYVSDVHGHEIKVFAMDGRLIRSLGKRGDLPGEFNFPTYLAFVEGELYVTDTINARIQVIDGLTGHSKRIIGQRGLNIGNLVRPKGVAVDADGNVYVVESYHDYLLVFNRNGEFLLPIGGTGAGVGQFYLPTSVWVDENNRIFVADMFNSRVSIFQYLGK